MKKKLFAAAMAGTMVLRLAACGGSKPAETTAAPAAADKTEAAAEGETKAEAAAESLSLIHILLQSGKILAQGGLRDKQVFCRFRHIVSVGNGQNIV